MVGGMRLQKGAGWALTDKRTYKNQDHQDQLDAATIYEYVGNGNNTFVFC